MDGQTGYCLGCGRTLAEIGQWTSLTDQGRDAILALLPDRIGRLTSLGKR